MFIFNDIKLNHFAYWRYAGKTFEKNAPPCHHENKLTSNLFNSKKKHKQNQKKETFIILFRLNYSWSVELLKCFIVDGWMMHMCVQFTFKRKKTILNVNHN